MAGPYDTGNTIVLAVTFNDPTTGAYVDPTTVVISVLQPGTTTPTTPAVTRDGQGRYHAEVICTVAGQWWWRVDTTSPQAGSERSFLVNPSHV